MSESYKTVRLSQQTYQEVARLGTLSDSFDSVIYRLAKTAQKGGTQ